SSSGRVNRYRKDGAVQQEITHGMSTILKETALTFRDTVRLYMQGERFPADRGLCWLIPLRTGHPTNGNILRQKGCLIIRSPSSNQTQITLLSFSITTIREAELFGRQAINIKFRGR